jgi:hypothetical protein
MTLLRRFLVVVALMFWQGGFIFYAAVVVPIGQANIGHLEQGILITREVTHYLNLAGAAALLLFAWDMVESANPARLRAWCRWFTWAAMLGSLAALIWLHPHLERLLDVDARGYVDSHARLAFHPRHRLYLWLSTVQWACAVAYAILTLQSWRLQDLASGSLRENAVKPSAGND